MKTNPTLHLFLALAGSSLLAISSASAQATSNTWDTDADGNWTDPLNWLGDTNYAGGADNTATLGNFITGNRTITLTAPITIGNITASDTGQNYTISGANTLTLDRTTGTPAIDVTTASRTLTISSNVAGNDGLSKTGAGTLSLFGTANSYSGGTTISAGTLRGTLDTTALGVSPFGSGAIQLNGGTLGLRTDVGGNNSAQTVTYGNDVTVGGNATIDYSRNGNAANSKTHALGNLTIGSNTLTITSPNIGHFLSFTGATLTGDAIINTANRARPSIGAITETGGSRSLTLQGVSNTYLELLGSNTYTGDTTVSAGSNLRLAASSSTLFDIGANGVNNAILGAGTVNLSGAFFFDLSSASVLNGNSWSIVYVGNLNETFGSTFSVDSTFGAFTETANVWSLVDGGNTWTFTEATGVLGLAVIPEPSAALLGSIGLLALLRRRR